VFIKVDCEFNPINEAMFYSLIAMYVECLVIVHNILDRRVLFD